MMKIIKEHLRVRTHQLFSDWISEMKRIDKQKMETMLYDNYVDRIGMQKMQASKQRKLDYFLV